jgi:hypothetical protein
MRREESVSCTRLRLGLLLTDGSLHALPLETVSAFAFNLRTATEHTVPTRSTTRVVTGTGVRNDTSPLHVTTAKVTFNALDGADM